MSFIIILNSNLADYKLEKVYYNIDFKKLN